jgi:hypothetical protein
LRLNAADWNAKQKAALAYRSQLEPLGLSPLDGPVVHSHELALMLRLCEDFLAVTP